MASPEKNNDEGTMKSTLIAVALLVSAPVLCWAEDDNEVDPGFNEPTFKGLELRGIGRG